MHCSRWGSQGSWHKPAKSFLWYYWGCTLALKKTKQNKNKKNSISCNLVRLVVNNNISVGFIKIPWSGLTVHYILIKQCHICFTTNCKRPCFDWHTGDHRHGNNVSELINELRAKRPAHLEMIKKHKNRLQAPLPRWLWLEESWKSLSDDGYIKTMKKKRKKKQKKSMHLKRFDDLQQANGIACSHYTINSILCVDWVLAI